MNMKRRGLGLSFSGSLHRLNRRAFLRLVENDQCDECHAHDDVAYDHCNGEIIHRRQLYLKAAGLVWIVHAQFTVVFGQFVFGNRSEKCLDQFLGPRVIVVVDAHSNLVQIAHGGKGCRGDVALKRAVDAVLFE